MKLFIFYIIAIFLSISVSGCDNHGYPITENLELPSGTSRELASSDASLMSSDTNIVKIQGNKVVALQSGKAVVYQIVDGKKVGEFNVSVRPFRLYSIGNSHTWDLKPDGDLVTMAKVNNVNIENDWHIYCGHNIDNIIKNPEKTCVPPKAYKYKQAINSVAYDAITIEPFFGSTGKSEVDAIESLIKEIRRSKSKNAKIYIYYTWPQNDSKPLDEMNYNKIWNQPTPPTSKQFNNNSTFIEHMKNRFKSDGYNVDGFIPIGDYLSEFDSSARNGDIPGFTGAGNLYRDYLHMNNVGKLIISKKYLESIFNIDNIEYADGTYLPGQVPNRDKNLSTEIKLYR